MTKFEQQIAKRLENVYKLSMQVNYKKITLEEALKKVKEQK